MDSSVYLTSLTFSCDAESIEDVQANADDLIGHAESLGFSLVDGTTSLSRERDPIEQVVHSAGDVFRNKLAQKRLATAGHSTDSREDRSLIASDPEEDDIDTGDIE